MKFLRSLFVLAILLAGFALVSKASDYTMTLSTNVPTASATEFNLISSSVPLTVAKNMSIRKLIISNYGASQNVTVYDTCTSSTAASLSLSYSLAASTASVVVDFPGQSYNLTNPCITKDSTSSVVKATLIYQ